MPDRNILNMDQLRLFQFMIKSGWDIYRPGLQVTDSLCGQLVQMGFIESISNDIAGRGYIINPVFLDIRKYSKCLVDDYKIKLLRMIRTGKYE